jgi:hypothetical protein
MEREKIDGNAPEPSEKLSARKKLVFTLMTFLIVAFALLLAGELYARFALGLGNPIIYEDHYLLGYRMKPNQTQTRKGGNVIKINSIGCRDEEPDMAAGTLRILVVGDSVTYGGSYITREQLYTTQLEKILNGANAFPGGKVQVINCGVNGYSYEHAAKFLTLYMDEINPGIVVAAFPTHNFYRTFTEGRNPAFPRHRPVLAVQEALAKGLPAIWNRIIRKESAYSRRKDFITENYAPLTAYNFEQVRFIRDITNRAGKKFYLSLTPMREEMVENVPEYNGRLRDDVGKFAATEGIQWHDALPAFMSGGGAGLLVDSVHFNADGHTAMARDLAAFLENTAFKSK